MLFGHEDKVELFTKLKNSGGLGHAYLFFGDKGIGKFTFAKMLGNFLERKEFGISKIPLIDMMITEPGENGSIGIDEARAIKRFLFRKPFASERRIAIIRGAGNLTNEAEGALLKIVEEPPVSSLILFIAENEHLLFPPLSSRLTKIYFRRFKKGEIEETLKSCYNIPEKEAKEIGERSFGSMERAISALQKKKKKNENEDLFEEILDLRNKGVKKNSGVLKELLKRQTLLRRFRLNANLQSKAITYIKTHHGHTGKI